MPLVQVQGWLNMEAIDGLDAGQHVDLDLREVSFCYPSGLVGIACLIRDAASVDLRWPDNDDQKRYLSRMGIETLLRQWHNVPSLPIVRHRKAELCEVASFENTGDIDRLADLVGRHASDAHLRSDLCWALGEGTWELCVNATTHSQWPGGGILCAQHYRQRGEIEYAVADAGIGILASLVPAYPELVEDADAIIRAREYGVTRFGQDQQGAGLSETVDLVTSLDGILAVRSGRAVVTFRQGLTSTSLSERPWQGTPIKVILPL